MDTWNINKKSLLKSGLYIEKYLILLLIYEQDFKYLKQIYENLPMLSLEALQYHNYIRLEGSNWEDIVLTNKSKGLFESDKSSIEAIIEVLNKESKSKYRASSVSTKRHLNARLQEYSVEEIINTTKYMCKEWLNTSMETYLRPETLYNESKFQTYYNKWYKNKHKTLEVNRM